MKSKRFWMYNVLIFYFEIMYYVFIFLFFVYYLLRQFAIYFFIIANYTYNFFCFISMQATSTLSKRQRCMVNDYSSS